MLKYERPMIYETPKYATSPATVPIMQPRNIIRNSSVAKMPKTELVKQPKAFITPMSRIRSDIARENKKSTTSAPVKRLRMLTNTMKREKIKEKPDANCPPVTDSRLNPMFSPIRMRKIVEATDIVKLRIVRRVGSFLRFMSLIGKGILLKPE